MAKGVVVTFIPEPIELPVVSPKVPALMLRAVALPMILFVMVMDAAAPDTFIPKTPPAIAAVVPEDERPPIVLIFIETVPVEEEWIPTTAPCVVVGVATMLSTPLVAPIVLPDMSAVPAVKLMPQIIPFVVAAPLEVPRLIAAMVFD